MAGMPRLSVSSNLENGDTVPGLSSPGPTRVVPSSPSTGGGGGGGMRKASTFTRGSISPGGPDGAGGGGSPGPSTGTRFSNSGGATISNMHAHHYHYHLYQTTITETGGGDKKEDAEDEHDEQEDAELAELMEMFPDGIPEELLTDDGSGVPQEIVDENGNVITVIKPRPKAMKNIFGVHDLSHKDLESLTWFAKLYRFLHDPSSGYIARIWSIMMVLAIIVSSVMILMQSMPNLRFLDSINDITYYVEFYSVCLFTADYVAKLFSVHAYADCVLPKPLPYNVLWRFFTLPLNLLDFASVVPFWIQLVMGDSASTSSTLSLVFRIVRLLRIMRLLKVAQYSRSIDIFFRVIIQAWDALLLLLFFTGFGCIVFGTLIFMCEQGVATPFLQEDGSYVIKYMRKTVLGSTLEESPFTSIPQSFWFVCTTLTTVGYGDMVPTSMWGKVVGGVTQLSGVLFISTPLVIFGTHFQNEFTKELDRVAFVHRRQEKIKKRQAEKEKAEAEKAKQEAEARVAAGGTRYGFDDTDPMAAAMGLGGGGYESPLPGAVPPSPGPNGDGFGSPNRPFARGSVMMRGSTFGARTGSIMSPQMGGMGGMPGMTGGDVSIRVNDGTPLLGQGGSRGSIMPMGTSGFLQPMTMIGGGGSGGNIDSGCVCPCSCGARNMAMGTMPGANNVAGGVRRSVITKSGNRMTGPGAFVSNPTAADNMAVSKGMQMAAQVLPPKDIAERSAAQMASTAMTTQASNAQGLSAIEMQAQMDILRTLVTQLGALLLAGGAPDAGIAQAMMAKVVPPEAMSRSSRKSIKANRGSVMVGSGVSNSNAASDDGSPKDSSRTLANQPSSGKLVPKGAGSPKGINGLPVKRGSITGGSAAGAGGSPSSNGIAATSAPTFALPPAASNASVIPSSPATSAAASAGVEMSALSSPSASAGGDELASPSGVDVRSASSSAAAVHSDIQAGPAPTCIEQVIPARPVHTFPAAPDDEGTFDATMRMVGSLIQQPVLTEKLLQKPPFRFIHDIVLEMIRVRGFPDGYFEGPELDCAKLSDPGKKMEFLEKLIDLLSIVNSSDLSHVNPKKIIAGLEAENTNHLLQELARAAATGISVVQVQNMMENAELAAGIPAGGAGMEGFASQGGWDAIPEESAESGGLIDGPASDEPAPSP